MEHYLIGYYLIVNLGLFAFMAWDKAQAKRGGHRISEKRLLTLALLGGGAGGLAGIKMFRHKSKKPYFRLIFLSSLALHLFFIFRLLQPAL